MAPITQGCESKAIVDGAEIYLAGFGMDETDQDDSTRDEKRWIKTTINRVDKSRLYIGERGKGGCSGEPVYMKLKDGAWRTIAFTRGDKAHPDCAEGTYMRTDKLLD